MAFYRNLNKLHDTGHAVVWWLFKTLLQAGWTHRRSGSGTGGYFSDTTTPVFRTTHNPPTSPAFARCLLVTTGVGIGDEMLGMELCWFVLRAPTGTREIIFARHSTHADNRDGYWFIGVSPGGLYTGGSATVSATATDELAVYNSRSIANGIFASGLVANLVHVMANSTPLNGEYAFAVLEFTTPNAFKSFLWADPLDDLATASSNHIVFGVQTAAIGNMAPTILSRTTASPAGCKMHATDMSVQNATYCVPYGATLLWDSLGDQDEDLYDRPIQMPVALTAINGYKGISTLLFCGSAARTYPDTAEGGLHLYINNTVIKNMWDTVTIPASI